MCIFVVLVMNLSMFGLRASVLAAFYYTNGTPSEASQLSIVLLCSSPLKFSLLSTVTVCYLPCNTFEVLLTSHVRLRHADSVLLEKHACSCVNLQLYCCTLRYTDALFHCVSIGLYSHYCILYVIYFMVKYVMLLWLCAQGNVTGLSGMDVLPA